MTETTRELSARIRAYVTGRGHDWNIVAAATLIADCDLIMWKMPAFVDSDGWIEWERLAAHVDVSPWSSGEKAIIRLACSLAGYVPDEGGGPWRLSAMLRPLDGPNSLLVVEAVRYAAMGPK
jgi:hypothetical protein